MHQESTTQSWKFLVIFLVEYNVFSENIINYLLMFIQLLVMDNKYYSYWLALITLSGIFYIIFGTSYALLGFHGFLIIAGVLFLLSIIYGLWYSISRESHDLEKD